MPTPQSNFVWYELMTTDAEAAKAFYAHVIGWSTQDVPMAELEYTLFCSGGAQIGGLLPMSPASRGAGARPFWAGYVAVDDVDAACVRVALSGGMVHRPPAEIGGVGRFAVISDPQGAILQLFRASGPGASSSATAPGHVAWRELHSTDAGTALGFYQQQFHWEAGAALDMDGMGTYQLFHIDDQAVGGMLTSPIAGHTGFWLYYFAVDDIDAAASRLTDAGGQVLQGPHPVPGGAWMLQANDPQGAMFALLGARIAAPART